MQHDIAALQYMYGVNTTTRQGDTVYRWSSGEPLFETIYDSGGHDLLDWSNQTTDARISLVPGTWSELGAPYRWFADGGGQSPQTAFIYFGVLIENATGGSGNDTIRGNTADNVLTGGVGGDVLDGRTGLDTANYSNSPVSVSVSLETGAADGGTASGDVLQDIENLRGSDHNDTLIGDAEYSVLTARGGDDVLAGLAFQDILVGGSGADTADYSASNAGVTATLEIGVFGLGGHAQFDFLNSIENLRGSDFGDVLIGDGGANVLTGFAGDDILHGGAGADTADYEMSPEGISIFLGAQVGYGAGGHAGGDELYDIENLQGSNFDDYLRGNDGVNFLGGRGGDDLLAGRAGADILEGHQGEDTADYSLSPIGVCVNLAAGTAARGDAAGDELRKIEGLRGSDSGDDALIGDAGVNLLYGLGGADRLAGRRGADRLWGGEDNDIFRFAPGAGTDRIFDFNDFGDDTCRLARFGDDYDTFAEVRGATVQVGEDVRITLATPQVDPTVIWLEGTARSSLTADDFILA